MAGKPLACRLGRHAWTRRVEQGEAYVVCEVCGKQPSRRRAMIRGPGHGIDLDLPTEKPGANR